MDAVRKPVAAGIFYPDAQKPLQDEIDSYLANESASFSACDLVNHISPKAIIVPHAGYSYSGSTAAKAYSQLLGCQHKIKRVVLLGPSHRINFRGIAFSGADSYRTPLGNIPIDQSAQVAISNLPDVILLDQAHQQEHSIEVQLPFLQTVLSNFKVVPLVVGDTSLLCVANVLETLWGNEETLIVISSDLSHHHDYQSAQVIDSATCNAIEHLQTDLVGYDQACGRNPLNGLLEIAQRKKLRVRTLHLCNSGDTAGDKNRVVGYGAWAFYEDTLPISAH